MLYQCLIFLMNPPPLTSTLFPYTTLFRSPAYSYFPMMWAWLNPLSLSWTMVLSVRLMAASGLILNFWDCRIQFSNNILLRSEEHTSELQSRENIVCRLLLEKKKKK